jgi:hypothetical protein
VGARPQTGKGGISVAAHADTHNNYRELSIILFASYIEGSVDHSPNRVFIVRTSKI